MPKKGGSPEGAGSQEGAIFARGGSGEGVIFAEGGILAGAIFAEGAILAEGGIVGRGLF